MGFIIQIDVHQSNIWEIRREMCKHFLGGGLLPHGLQHCLHLLPLPEGENNPSVKILSKNWHQISKDCVVYDVLQREPTTLTNQWAIHLFARSCEPIRFLRNFRQRFSFPILRIFGQYQSINTGHQPTHLNSSWALLS